MGCYWVRKTPPTNNIPLLRPYASAQKSLLQWWGVFKPCGSAQKLFCALLPALSTIFLLFFVPCFLHFFSHFLLSYPGMFTVSSCSFVCAAVSCFYSHQVRSNVKTTTTTTNICSHVRHTYVTKGTYAFKYLYVCNR